MRILRWVLLCFGVVFLLLGNVLFWVNGTLFNSERFAGAVDETMARPEVQDRLATVISQEAAPEVDLQARLRTTLPDDLQFLVPLVGDSVTEELLYRVSLRLLSSDVTNNVRDEVVRRLHARVVSTLEDNDDQALEVEGGSLVLDLRPIVSQVFDRVGLPVPARLQQAGAEGKGQVVLVEDTQGLRAASFFVTNRGVFLVLALLAAIACLAGAALLTEDRMRGVSRAGFAVATTGILTLLIVFIANSFIPDERIVLRELVKSLETNLRSQSLLLLATGAIMVVVSDASIRASASSARRSVGAYSQRLGNGTPLLLAMGVVTLLLFVM